MAAASDVHEQARSLSATRAHLSGHGRHHSTASQPLSPGNRLSPHASSPRFVWAKFRRQVDDLIENEDFSGAAQECRSCMNSAATNEIPLSSSDLCLVLLDYGDVKRKQTRYHCQLNAEDLCFDLDSTISQIRDLQTKPHLYPSNSSQEEAEVSSRSNGRHQQNGQKPTNDDEEPASVILHSTVTPDLIPHKEHAREAIEAYHRALQLSIECSDIALQVRCYRRFSRLILDLIYSDKAVANELLPHAARCAEEYLLKAVSLMHREEETHSLLAQLYYETHRFEESKTHLEIACKIDENETTLKLLGVIEGFHMRQLRLASKRLKRVVGLNNDTDNLFLIAHLLVCDDKLQQAHDFLRSAIAREENEAAAQSPDDDDEPIQNPDVHALFAWICTNAEFYDRNLAEQHFKIALSVDKDHLSGHLYLALYYAHICDNNENAKGHFRFCHGMDKENDVTLFFYGLLQKYRLGKKQRGERYIEDASVEKLKNRLAEQQGDPDFHNSKPCFCLSRLEYNNHYHGLSAWSPNQYFRQARILLSHGKMIESVEVIRRILSLEEHEGARNLLRQLYEAQQQQEQEKKTSIERHEELPVAPPIDMRRRQRSDPRLMVSAQAEEYRQQRTRRASELRHSSPRLPGLRKRSKSECHPVHTSHPSFGHESSQSGFYGGMSPHRSEYTASPRTPVSIGPRYTPSGYSSGSCPTSPTYHMSPSLGPTARFASTYAGASVASNSSFSIPSQVGPLPNQMYFAVEPDFVNPGGGYFGGVPGGEYPMKFDDDGKR